MDKMEKRYVMSSFARQIGDARHELFTIEGLHTTATHIEVTSHHSVMLLATSRQIEL